MQFPKTQYLRDKNYLRKVAALPCQNCGIDGFSQAAQERKHKESLASIGCAVCWRIYEHHEPGLVELHHLRTGGWGKGDYKTLIPLCVEHHRGNTGIHGLGTKGFEKHYGFSQKELLEWSLTTIGQVDVIM